MSWFLKALRQYVVFGGRSRRKEYWYFLLVYLLIYMVLGAIDTLFGWFNKEAGFGLLSGVFMATMILPSLSVAARRLHDIGYSAWWLLLGLLPFLGGLALMIMAALPGTRGDNRYGPDPLAGGDNHPHLHA